MAVGKREFKQAGWGKHLTQNVTASLLSLGLGRGSCPFFKAFCNGFYPFIGMFVGIAL